MANQSTANTASYQPSESVEENLKQIQSRQQAEKAKIKNTTAKVTRLARRGMYNLQAGMSMLNLNGVTKAAEVATTAFSDEAGITEEETQIMSGTMELPDGIDAQADACAKAASEGKHPKQLSWEPFSDKLSVPALTKAWNSGLIDYDNSRYQQVSEIQAKYDGVKPVETTVQQAAQVFVPGVGKKLPEVVTDNTKDFLASAYDISEAMVNASDYLITDESQLGHMYEASHMGMSEAQMAESSTGMVHSNADEVTPVNDYAAKAAEFEQYVMSQGMQAAQSDFGFEQR